MRTYVVRRIFLFIPTLVLMSLLVFGLLRVLPGDVAQMILGDSEGGYNINPNARATLRQELGLTKPIHLQYLGWLWDVARGNLGNSLLTRKPVKDEILHRIPLTFELALLAQGLSLLIGIPVGILAAVKQNTWIDYLLRFWSIFFLAAPSFWLGLLIILGGALWFHWSPPLGYNLLWQHPLDNVLQLMWPALILSSHGLAIIARMTRSTMLEVLREDYIRTARAKGLREQVVIARHAMKNALIPVVTLSGISFGNLLGGTVIMEAVFSIPGIGTFLLQGIRQRDYTVVQGTVVMFAAAFMTVNLAVDLLYGWLDPRITYK